MGEKKIRSFSALPRAALGGFVNPFCGHGAYRTLFASLFARYLSLVFSNLLIRPRLEASKRDGSPNKVPNVKTGKNGTSCCKITSFTTFPIKRYDLEHIGRLFISYWLDWSSQMRISDRIGVQGCIGLEADYFYDLTCDACRMSSLKEVFHWVR